MKSIFLKIFGGYIAFTILLLAPILYFSYQSIEGHYLKQLSEDLRKVNCILSDHVSHYLLKDDLKDMQRYLEGQSENIQARITIIGVNGQVLADTDEDPNKMENHKDRPEVSLALSGRQASRLRYSSTLHQNMLYEAMPVRDHSGIVIAVSRVSLFAVDINELINSLLLRIFQIIAVVVVISLFFIYFFSRSISDPIKQLARAAEKVAMGKFEVKVRLNNKDELQNLADSFNYMTIQIKNLFDQISIKSDELNNIMDALKDGLFVLSSSGRIVSANSGFNKITGTDETVGKYYFDFIGDEDFAKMFNKIVKKHKSQSREIMIGDVHFLCSGHSMDTKDAFVFILYDLSEIKEFEQVKRDFVTNVSHELRTPLTAIKGFIETLEDDTEISTQNKHYLSIIHKHTNRLINIVQDLLLLSKLEQAGSNMEIHKVDMNALLANVLVVFQEKIKEKYLILDYKVDKNVPQIFADAFKLEQMLINLVDNAIKYTDEGGIDVQIKASSKWVHIIIEDTGLGIPDEHMERIFERFYILDKSRSRKVGGTGLGLSIVKHIVNLHNGTIDVKSKVGKGTRFTIKLPVNIGK